VIRIASEARGDGFPVLLVMGQGYARWAWEPVAEPLSRRYRVVSFDPRGVGGSDKPAGPYSVEELTADALRVLDEHGIERAHVVGASLGGMVAQELAISHPARVEKLALLCTSSGFGKPVPMLQSLVGVYQAAAGLEPEAALRVFVENAVSERSAADELVRRRLENPIEPAMRDAQGAAALAFDSWERLDRITAPTLVATGDADNVVDWRSSEALAGRIPNARLAVLPGAGHMFWWDDPAATVALLEEFLG
jgi:3-oxoadipate enol-lactonase